MLKRYKVSSGDYEITVSEVNINAAAGLAIKLHELKKNEKTKLGILTLVELIGSNEHGFLSTETLIANYTNGDYDDCR